MKYFLKYFVPIMMMLFCQGLKSDAIVVVVNSSNKEAIDKEVVKLIYSDKKSFWKNGKRILLFELPVKSVVREKFSQTILKKSAMSSQSDWSNRYINNTIKNKVKIKPHKIVVRFVSIKKSAIGYIPVSALGDTDNLRVVMTIH